MDQKETTSKEQIAVLVGAGEFTSRRLLDLPRQEVLLIAADAGLRHLEELRLVPDIVIGDYDSLGYVPQSAPGSLFANDTAENSAPVIITLQVEKDDTDMEAALRLAMERGCREIYFYGASGGRPDHFLANLQLLAYAGKNGHTAQLVAPTYTVYAVTNGNITLQGEKDVTFSVFSIGGAAQGVTISGDVKYPAEKVLLSGENTLGVSNLMTGPEAFVEVIEGTLLIFQYCTPSDAV